jgi:hypothetical protein
MPQIFWSVLSLTALPILLGLVDRYQSIADTIVQLFRLHASGLMT